MGMGALETIPASGPDGWPPVDESPPPAGWLPTDESPLPQATAATMPTRQEPAATSSWSTARRRCARIPRWSWPCESSTARLCRVMLTYCGTASRVVLGSADERLVVNTRHKPREGGAKARDPPGVPRARRLLG